MDFWFLPVGFHSFMVISVTVIQMSADTDDIRFLQGLDFFEKEESADAGNLSG